MKDTTLTLSNMKAIHNAMGEIKHIDRSNYFNQYYEEVMARVQELTLIEIDLLDKELQELQKAKKS